MTRAGHVAHRVYDPVLRMLHGVNALLIVLLGAGGVAADNLSPGATRAWLHDTHGMLGAALIVGLLCRLAWGWAGPTHARWRDLWHPADWRAHLARGRLFTPPARPGHHPVASLAYLAVYALLAALAASGLSLLASTQGTGPLAAVFAWDARLTTWLADPHRLAGWAVLFFVCVHLTALVLHARLHRVPVAQSMWNGVQYLESK
jgi:Ni,Fe-hydrogenase I cytochrome b subunit